MTVQVKTNINFAPLIRMRKGINKAIGVKVGILGDKEQRNNDGAMGNAEVGLIQEAGSITNGIPARSFLRMPLESNKSVIEEALKKNNIQDKLYEGDANGAMQLIGFVAEKVIDDAFKTDGFGKWAPNKPSTIAKKGSSKPLIDTSQLRRGVTSKVVEKYNG